MKDKLRFVTIIMLAVVLVFMVFLYAGQRSLENKIDNLEGQIAGSIQSMSVNMDYQIRQALLSEKFIAIELRDEFPKTLPMGRKASGTIYFELMEDKDYDEIYVVIYGTDNEIGNVYDTVDMGSLRYKADVELDIDDYTYYVVGKDAEGSETMLSYKQTIYLKERAHNRVLLYGGWGYGSNTGELTANGILQIDNSGAGIQKVELKIAMESDYIQYKENYEDYIIKIFDITESLVKTDVKELDDGLTQEEYYTTYTYDISGTMTEEDGYDPNRGSAGIAYAVVVTFDDGTQAEAFS